MTLNLLDVRVRSELQQYLQATCVFLRFFASCQVNRSDSAVAHQVGTGTFGEKQLHRPAGIKAFLKRILLNHKIRP